MRPTEEFTPLRIVKKNLTDSNRCAYRVYKSPDEYVTVDAATALEAFRESGIANPYRILRETRFMERLVDQNKFSDREELVETGVSDAASPGSFIQHPPAPQNAMESPPQRLEPIPAKSQAEDNEIQVLLEKTPPAEEVLSPDDVSKLLGS